MFDFDSRKPVDLEEVIPPEHNGIVSVIYATKKGAKALEL